MSTKFGKGVFRFPWEEFPEVLIHGDEKIVRNHADYVAAKTGDSEAAFRLVNEFIDESVLRQMGEYAEFGEITLVSAHALERDGVNAIPEAMAEVVGAKLNWPIEHQIVQVNIVSHTKADGFSRIARQARFDGKSDLARLYFLVDDFVGQGGTLANLRGWLMHQGSRVVGATVLTGKAFSSIVTVSDEQIDKLTETHGQDLQEWWNANFGFDYNCLTSSEARYLIRTPAAQRVRDKIVAAVEKRSK